LGNENSRDNNVEQGQRDDSKVEEIEKSANEEAMQRAKKWDEENETRCKEEGK
jgi:hypothetical protein